jgi:AraC family transcriptional activator of pobA
MQDYPGSTSSPSLRLQTLAQVTQGGEWQLSLAHDNEAHLFIWITRGQGLALMDGSLRGVGTHNALFIPARHLMSLDMGRQSYGQVVTIPQSVPVNFPEAPYHLRSRDVIAQKELTGLFEALNREQMDGRAHSDDAMAANTALMAIWLRRQLLIATGATPDTAATRLVRAFTSELTVHYASGATMADYAQRLGVTPTHLTRVCKSETGKTAATLLTERVLHAARQLLQFSGLPVRNIAKFLGFGSAAYFTRFIQHHTGQTPTGLRQGAGARTV